ncbi:autotransporter assembly complex protein TamA [Pontiellaceae bacterium B12227]|nr:autotransporter assembly complex protein TamA [Pontiellaceae bacterium B12227]
MLNRFLSGLVLSALAWMCMVPTVFSESEVLEYSVKLKGAKDNAVKRAVNHSARTITMRKRPPSTLGQLRRRIQKDIPAIEAILESRGYYDGRVSSEIDTDRSKVRVYLRIEQGEPYRFRSVKVLFPGNNDEQLAGIKPLLRRRKKVVAADVFEEQRRIIEQLNRRGYPFAALRKRTVEVDRENQQVDLTLEFAVGPLAFFGPVVVEGLDALPPKYIQRQVPWREGRRYDSKLVRDFETRLLGTGQFGSARVAPRRAASGTNAIPIVITLNERAPRTIRAGVNYSDIGPGGRLYWEHRNIFGAGERFESSVSASPIELLWDARLTRSGFLDGNQSLVLDLEASRESPDAYDARKAKTTAMVLRDFTPNIQAGLGLGYYYSRVEQFSVEDRFNYVFLPLQLSLDYRDDRLNPMRGYQAFGRTIWNEDTHGSDSFLKTYLEGRDYHLLWERARLSSAFRLSLGSIDGADISTVPADERFYAGGGGSIRGYEYQSVGPKLNGTPTGGNKLLEFSAELRMQPGQRLGYVVFLDGGTVYNDVVSDELNRSLRYGAGIGVRWFTAIGPLRADLAYPLNPDSSQEKQLQFYISLGQAF